MLAEKFPFSKKFSKRAKNDVIYHRRNRAKGAESGHPQRAPTANGKSGKGGHPLATSSPILKDCAIREIRA
jgi:hypothetical protein